MSKYRIRSHGDGYKVQKLTEMGGLGYAWIDERPVFKSKESAQKYIDDMRGDNHEQA